MTSAMKLFQSAKSVDPLERALLSFTFEQKNLKHHFGKPSIINLQHPKSFSSKTIDRRSLETGTCIPELLRVPNKKETTRDLRPWATSTGSALG